MITLNTNLSSMIVQSNLTTSTKGLNQAIERMTTGFKINNAKDNAANYSISTSLAGKLSSYNVAQDNVAMGLDMLTTAEDSLSLISNHLSRIRDLTEQAANGTYGASSLSAIQSEINARLAECARIHSNTEYNGIKLFEDNSASESLDGPVAQYDGFIEEVQQLTEEEAIAQGYTVIKTADELQAMENDLNGKYILMNDIDLAGYDWEAVGDKTNGFKGEFNGNGFVIRNLTINTTEDYQGLFGYADDDLNLIISNVGLVNVNVKGGNNTGALVGYLGPGNSGMINNCYSSGKISGNDSVGGLGGDTSGSMKNSYSTCTVTGNVSVGGIVGSNSNGDLINCYATGYVSGYSEVGGLAGYNGQYINNCYSKGSVKGHEEVGGLIGFQSGFGTYNSYTISHVQASTDNYVGSFMGSFDISNSIISNSTYYSSVNANIPTIGGFVEQISGGFAPTTGENADIRNLIDGGKLPVTEVNFQTGIHSDESSQISLSLGFNFSLTIDVSTSYAARNALEQIDEILSQISAKQTEYGAAYNRMESALESIGVSIDNLTSTQSTIRDADIAEVSSEYIQMQILQQASATLLATANQTPSIALQLL